jgi:hypothetical protein
MAYRKLSREIDDFGMVGAQQVVGETNGEDTVKLFSKPLSEQ